ncbi:MAG: hypothetical protein V2J42_11000 [Wenzhouxiangella sp.]|jgi:hypothetical protein|nr:hypothetical protein [Wenzhouxiangella sp.]
MTTRSDVERLLRDLPIETPEEVSAAESLLATALTIVNGALGGAQTSFRVMNPIADARNLVQQMQQGRYGDASVTLISMVGSAADVVVMLVKCSPRAGVVTGLSASSSAGVVGGMLSEAAGPAAIAAATMFEVGMIPVNVDENFRKLYFIADASGILTSWMFNLPQISPHQRLLQRARTGGYHRSNVSDACELAHRQVHRLWQRSYLGNAQARRSARRGAQDSWQTFWRQSAAGLSNRLRPVPLNAGLGWANDAISHAQRQARQQRSDAAMQSFQQRMRRAQGGVYLSDGLFWPDR